MIREIFSDNNGRLSSKRLAGMGLVIAGGVGAFMGLDSEAVQWLLITGVASLGVGTFETKVSK